MLTWKRNLIRSSVDSLNTPGERSFQTSKRSVSLRGNNLRLRIRSIDAPHTERSTLYAWMYFFNNRLQYSRL